jgi:branched-chain amino acid transport system substrate-binding protein
MMDIPNRARNQSPTSDRRRRLVLAGAASLGGLAVHTASKSQPAEVVIGAVLPLTGPSASFGQNSWNALQLACEWANERGGVKALGGAKFRAVIGDTQSLPEVAASQTEQLIRRGSHVLLGCNQSAASIIATQVAERAGIPFITAYDIDPAITARGFKYTFRASPLIDAYARDMVTFVKLLSEKHGKAAPRLVAFSENSIAGQSANRFIQQTASRIGVQLVENITYDVSKTQNFAPYISRFKAANADAVVGHNRTSDGILIVRTMKELGYNPAIMGGILGAPSDPEFVKNLGASSNYILGSESFSAALKIPGLPEVASRYQQKYGRPMDVGSATMFGDLAIIWDAVERSRTTQPKELRDAMAATELAPGDRGFFLLGGVKFTETGDNGRAGGMITMLRDGNNIPVYPTEVAVTSATYPKPAWA